MKILIANILFLIVWTILGHYIPSVILITTFIFVPVFFIVLSSYFKFNLKGYYFIPLSFLTILINDFLFRSFGGGIHDDAGRGWCDLIFYITLIISTFSMVFIAYFLSKNNSRFLARSFGLNIFIVLLSSLITYLFFTAFSLNK